jgi:poly(ribitol-phosphate) beta-N-acetylglucosaminyltransferase
MTTSQKNNYEISVIVPVYNVEEYLEEGLESITTQSVGMENIEVIMINDCSTDNSGLNYGQLFSKI